MPYDPIGATGGTELPNAISWDDESPRRRASFRASNLASGMKTAAAITTSEHVTSDSLSAASSSSILPLSDGDDDATAEKDDMTHAGFLYRYVKRSPRLYNFLLKWPRTFSLLLGVILPQFFLVFLSVVVGIVLALVEAPYEVTANDQILSTNVLEVEGVISVTNTSIFLPAICLELFAKNRNASDIDDYILDTLDHNASSMSSRVPFSPSDPISLNITELHDFLLQCGEFARPLVDNLVQNETESAKAVTGALTFNWIRCIPGAKGLDKVAGMANVHMIPEMRYDAQQQYFMQTWFANQQQLYQVYYAELIAANVRKENATLIASRNSILNATGGGGCELNAPASGWFWFTVLSTVGYGNQSPDSPTGQALVYTLGFVCILAFGGILSTAGYISSAIFDDVLVRFSLRFMTWPCISCVVWGSFYYIWMALIAVVTLDYKVNRVGDTGFTMGQGYWFSYISITTIGLGDIVLDAETFLYKDLIGYSMLFLVGFVLIAAFLSKLIELLTHMYGHKSLVEEMIRQLRSTDLLNEAAKEMVEHAAEHLNDGANKVVTGMRELGEAPAAMASHAVEHVNDGTHRMVEDLQDLRRRNFSKYTGDARA